MRGVENGTTDRLKSGLDAYIASSHAGGDRLVLDFSQVDYISSVGLRVLMLAGKEIREHGGSIVVAALQPVVREIFEISRFNLVFQCFGSVREALTKVSPTALATSDSAHGTCRPMALWVTFWETRGSIPVSLPPASHRTKL